MDIFVALVDLIGFWGAVLLISFLALLIAILILFPNGTWLSSRIPYFFPYSLIRGEEGKILNEQRILALVGAGGFQEAISALSNTDFGPYVGLEEDPDFGLFRVYLAHVHEGILKIVPGQVRDFFDALIRTRWDIENIEHVIAEKYSKKKLFGIPEDIINVGSLSEEQINSLAEAEGVEDVITKLENTEYEDVLKKGMKDWERTGLISSLIDPLYIYYFQKLKEQLSYLKGVDRAVADTILGIYIDIRNLKTLFRLAKEGIPFEETLGYMTPGMELYNDIPASAMEGGVEGLLEHLTSTSSSTYATAFSKLLGIYEKEKDLSEVEKVFDGILLERAKDISSSQVFNIGVILAYLFLKEAEIDSIKTIVMGLKMELEEDDIKKQLVMEAI